MLHKRSEGESTVVLCLHKVLLDHNKRSISVNWFNNNLVMAIHGWILWTDLKDFIIVSCRKIVFILSCVTGTLSAIHSKYAIK